jgi:hypothetical protein
MITNFRFCIPIPKKKILSRFDKFLEELSKNETKERNLLVQKFSCHAIYTTIFVAYLRNTNRDKASMGVPSSTDPSSYSSRSSSFLSTAGDPEIPELPKDDPNDAIQRLQKEREAALDARNREFAENIVGIRKAEEAERKAAVALADKEREALMRSGGSQASISLHGMDGSNQSPSRSGSIASSAPPVDDSISSTPYQQLAPELSMRMSRREKTCRVLMITAVAIAVLYAVTVLLKSYTLSDDQRIAITPSDRTGWLVGVIGGVAIGGLSYGCYFRHL